MEDEQQQVVWMPAFPVAVVVLLLHYYLLPLGVLAAVVGLVGVVVGGRSRPWRLRTWLALGAVIGAVLFWVYLGLVTVF
ncbi:hypothetical protein AB3X52_09470 [Nocardioides sp. DS6]|uniref:DUF4190 domain-containing protein n=1 Tax=Nocardioides eburneus TaxID=3231482 RepID=A0ABV3T0S3_9ACTN